MSVQASKRCVVPVCGARGAFSWLGWFPKTGNENIQWLFCFGGGAIFITCLTSFSKLLETRYSIHLGRAGKTVSFDIGFTKHDCYHLMGLHYLEDRHDNRGRNFIFDELLSSEEARNLIATSSFIDDNVRDRIRFTGMLESLLDDNSTIFRYNPKRLTTHMGRQSGRCFIRSK